MAKVTYLGHAAFYIEGKGIKALIDPFCQAILLVHGNHRM